MKRGSGCCTVYIYCIAALTSLSHSVSYIASLFSEWRIPNDAKLRWTHFTLKNLISNLRPKDLQITMLVMFEIFGRAMNHGEKFPKLSQTSFSGIVYCSEIIYGSFVSKVASFTCRSPGHILRKIPSSTNHCIGISAFQIETLRRRAHLIGGGGGAVSG